MAKNDNSFLGSIFKGAIDLTAGTIKFAYDAAEEITKAGYKAATSDSAKKIYKSLIVNNYKDVYDLNLTCCNNIKIQVN